MRFTSRTAVALATLLAPLSVTGRQSSVSFSNDEGFSAGAVYFMSNDPTGNYLFAADIGLDAKLTLTKGYSTGGAGGHAIGVTNPLFSQSSIVTSQESNVVIVVNAGTNTLTTFQVNPTDPTVLQMLGSPVPSGGEFPVSVAINKAGNLVCALNGGAVNGVSCFKLDTQRGLTPLDDTTRSLNLPLTTPPTGQDTTVGQILFRENDTKLVVSVKGSSTNPLVPGFLAAWDVNSDGSLSVGFAPTIGGVYTGSLTEIPGRNALLAGDAIVGYDIFDLAAAARDPTVIGQKMAVQGQETISCSEFSNTTGNFYLTDSTSSRIYEITVDDTLTGALIERYDLDRHDGPLDLSISNVLQKDRLYLLAANNTALEVFNVNDIQRLNRIQKLDVGRLITRAGLQFDPLNVVGLATYIV